MNGTYVIINSTCWNIPWPCKNHPWNDGCSQNNAL